MSDVIHLGEFTQDSDVPKLYKGESGRQFLVAVDGSYSSKIALYHALNLMRKGEDSVHIIHVAGKSSESEKNGAGYLAHCGGLVNDFGEKPGDYKYTTQLIKREEGKKKCDPRSTICSVATEKGADYIVLGSRGKNPIVSLVIGSVARHVAFHAPCPVLIAREDPESKKQRLSKVKVVSKDAPKEDPIQKEIDALKAKIAELESKKKSQ
eukprot:TRINITY_DN7059_c0_g1_i2.p1 TRINITY_DN7059_c0_g1~~TRINITY_DN7059_c0_g1_i2.p1  ORF type:complete len:209 (-),score=39.88 TRINITY_DN7059_c0_g1_i2:28-654(-)